MWEGFFLFCSDAFTVLAWAVRVPLAVNMDSKFRQVLIRHLTSCWKAQRKTKKWEPASLEFAAVVMWQVSQCRSYRKNEERQERHFDNKLLCACVLFNLVLPEGVTGRVPHIWWALFEYLTYLLIVMAAFQSSPFSSSIQPLVLYKPLNICCSTLQRWAWTPHIPVRHNQHVWFLKLFLLKKKVE